MDAMGNKSAGHYNAFQKQRLGWLDPAAGQIVSTYSDGAHTISAFEAGSGTKAVAVHKGIDPATGSNDWYFIEYRQPLGFDSFLAGNVNVTGGLVIRTANDANAGSSVLLDMTPESATWDWGDPALEFGQSFTDPATGLTVTAVAGDGNSASLDVSFGAGSCVRADPLVALAPATGPWVAAGTPVDFTVSITNADSDACGSSTIDLSIAVPAGWAGSVSPASLLIDAGSTADALLSVVSAADAIDGFFDIDVSAANAASGQVGSAAATYVVSNAPDNSPPAPQDDDAQTMQDTSIVIDVLANDMDPDADPLVVVAVGPASYGSVAINADGTVTHTPRRKFKGQDSFSYTVSDGTETATAVVQVTVSRQSGGDGGGQGGGNGGGKGNGKK